MLLLYTDGMIPKPLFPDIEFLGSKYKHETGKYNCDSLVSEVKDEFNLSIPSSFSVTFLSENEIFNKVRTTQFMLHHLHYFI